jgi:hypothetical protein
MLHTYYSTWFSLRWSIMDWNMYIWNKFQMYNLCIKTLSSFWILYFELCFFLHMNLCWCNTRTKISCWMWDRYTVAVWNLCLPCRLIMATNKRMDLRSEILSKKVDKKHTSPSTFVRNTFLNINNWKLERKEKLWRCVWQWL